MPSRSAANGRQAAGEQFQRGEAVEGHAAQGVRPADHRGVANAGGDQLAASPNALAAEEQAVEITEAGPCRPSAARTNRASENRSWVCS